ncbi:MAG: 2-C-methyl-D-erythritol 4-phosphate cytidylyltransferase [Phycisphaerae bacterium]|jgi:2-C-methyl-D-erythritol 4-phosphate cytidylyltransferase
MAENVAVIICAAGASSRFGFDKLAVGGKRKKQFTDVDGRAAFLRSVEFFADRDDVKQILLAIPQEDDELVSVKWGVNLQFFNVKKYIGAAERFETVSKGLELIKNDIDLVAVHDAVRCCLKKEWLDKCFAEAAKTGAAMLAAPVVATIKKVKDGIIEKTVDRAGLYEAQTPQVFKTELLKRAYAGLGKLDKTKISDDAQLVESLGEKVAIVETDQSNIKITSQADIAIAEAIIKSRPKPKKEGYVGPYGEAQW